jgi:hypothetical protein
MTGRKIYLYTDRPDESSDVDALLKYLKDLGFKGEFKGDFFRSIKFPVSELALALAGCRILNFYERGGLNLEPGKSDIEYEKTTLDSSESIKLKENLSNIYDGFALSRYLRSHLKKGLHIIFTSRMMATYEGSRYHGRVIIMDFPLVMVSTTGVVEAPVRPREFYIKKLSFQRAEEMGFQGIEGKAFMRELEKEFHGRFIRYGDPQMTEVVKGYLLQAVFYLFHGEAFCADPLCRLYNAHSQEEMIRAQIESSRLCGRHESML